MYLKFYCEQIVIVSKNIDSKNTLVVVHPHLALEWSPENDRTPNQVSKGSHYEAKWICLACGHRWSSTVNNRASHKHGCPKCGILKKVANRQGISVEDLVRARSEERRFCKVHGFQDLDQYNAIRVGSLTQHVCKKCSNQRNKDANKKLRMEVLQHYSPSLCCELCGEDHYEFLALDHIDGDGNTHRKACGNRQSTLYMDIKLRGFPKKFRVLCHNCNFKHRDPKNLGKGPRVTTTHQDIIKVRNRASGLKYKIDCINHYGGKCACCGIADLSVLSMDHIEGGGRRLKKAEAGHGRFYWLKKNKYPPGFRVLCMNCNLARGFYGHCPHEHDRKDQAPMKTITMMQLRSGPGELFREVWKHGRSLLITKGGKPAAMLVPPTYVPPDDTIVIERDGSFRGGIPLTFRQPITSGY